MSANTASDQLSPDELLCEEIARQLEQLRIQSSGLASELTLATPLLREQGLPLSSRWAERYIEWSESRARFTHEYASFAGITPTPELTLPDWKRALDRKRNELRASRDRDAAAVLEVTEVLQRVRELKVVKGEANTHAEVNELCTWASNLLLKLGDHAERRSVLEDVENLKGLRAILFLIDAAKDGSLDSEAEDQAVEVVELLFSRKLATALLRGRVTAPSRQSQPASSGAAPDYLSPDEATKRLTFGQPDSNPAPVRSTPSPTTAATLPIQIEALVLIGQRMQADLPGLYDAPLLSEAYSAIIEGIGYVEAVVKDPRRTSEPARHSVELSQALHLLAAIQSAMRAAAAPHEDERQVSVYRWLFQTAKEQSIFISRHMKIDDPADPKRFKEWVEQVRQARRKWDSPRRLTKVLNKIQHELKKSHDDPDAWEAVFRAVEEITGTEKLPPSYVPLRETLLPHLEHLPADMTPPDSFQQVLRAIDEYHRTLEQRQIETDVPHGQQNPEVQELSELLRGRAVVLIGGEVDQLAKARLERVFGLSELIWLEAHHEQSIERFAAPVQRPDVVLVMVVIRWMSHGHGDVKQYCDPLDKPFVRLQGTTHPNRVANDVLRQCGDVLRARYGAEGAAQETSAAG
jgi:hypothetical protein